MWNLRSIAAAIGLSALATDQAAAQSPKGTWLTQHGDAQIRIAECGGGALCGTIVWLKVPTDPATGKPPTDLRNPDPSRRSRPLIGVQVIIGMRPTATAGIWSARMYNANDGQIYTGHVTMLGPTNLKVEGCLGVLCDSETWTRAR